MPMRIVLVVAVLFALLYFIVLKHGSSTTRSTSGSSTTQTSSGTSTGTSGVNGFSTLAPLTSQLLASLPAPVSTALRNHQVLVVLFSDGQSPVDLIDQSQLSAVAQGGSVVTAIATPSQMAAYAPIAIPAGVQQVPSFVIVNPARQAEVLTGFVDSGTLELQVQAALAVPAATTP